MLNIKRLLITYADPGDHQDTITVPFKLFDNSVTHRWVQKVMLAQTKYNIDDPARFYGFGSLPEQQQDAIARINRTVATINAHERIIDRQLADVSDQDTLNYLHHIFEVYHGLLDQQSHPFYVTAPAQVKQALADLNIDVHRCESVHRSAYPRHVVTWYGLPKTSVLRPGDYVLFTDAYKFGTVYLNYTEIGKTFEDLSVDDDQYIADEAFRPFRHYSADFTVKFFDRDPRQLTLRHAIMDQYFTEHQEFFETRGLDRGHNLLKPGLIPLAEIDTDQDVLEELQHRQYVLSVNFQ